MHNDRRVRQMFALLGQSGVTARNDRLTLVGSILHRTVESTNDLDDIEIYAIVDVLNYWKRIDELKQRCAATLATEKRVTAAAQDSGDRQNHDAPQADDAVPGLPMRDARGNQLIQVQFETAGQAFTYVWAGDSEVKVGDKVLALSRQRWNLPPGATGVEHAVATVCALGSHYDGTIAVLTKRWKDDAGW